MEIPSSIAENLEVEKRLGELALRRLEATEKLAMDQVAAQSRWLTASLLAVNSAGLIATLQMDAADRPQLSLIGFCVGIGCALLSGAAIQEAYLNHLPSTIAEQYPYWTEVAISGERDENHERDLRENGQRNRWVHFIAPALGYASGLLWIASAVLLVFA